MFIKLNILIIALYILVNCYGKRLSHNVGIVGGHTISIEKVPFMSSLRLNGTYHWCGASIIHEQFVLTAAHCILPNREFKVLVGTDHVNNGGVLHDIEKIIKHDKYSNITNDYDICLLKLKEPLTFGPTVAKIELADKSVKLKNGILLDATGWGYTKPNGPISPNLLQVKLPAINPRSCKRSYYAFFRSITPRMLCAGGNGKDACQGDSGGPLTLNNVLIGVTSFGAECGVLPGVYTKISILQPWINKTIEDNQ